LPQLNELDLSDFKKDYAGDNVDAPWVDLFRPESLDKDEKLDRLLNRLTWLGLPDFRRDEAPFRLLQEVLPRCTSLKTLSIRGKYTSIVAPDDIDDHWNVCTFVHGIAKFAPKTVTTLELRMTFFFLDRLIDTLKTRESSIKRIGLDLGAWIQVFPRRRQQTEMSDGELRKSAITAALEHRYEAYKAEHRKHLDAYSRWWLPTSEFEIVGDFTDTQAHDTHETAQNGFAWDFYRNDRVESEYPVELEDERMEEYAPLCLDEDDHALELGGAVAEMCKHTTLVAMLNKIHEMVQERPHMDFFGL